MALEVRSAGGDPEKEPKDWAWSWYQEVGPGGRTWSWDPEVGPGGGTQRWDPEVGPGGPPEVK